MVRSSESNAPLHMIIKKMIIQLFILTWMKMTVENDHFFFLSYRSRLPVRLTSIKPFCCEQKKQYIVRKKHLKFFF